MPLLQVVCWVSLTSFREQWHWNSQDVNLWEYWYTRRKWNTCICNWTSVCGYRLFLMPRGPRCYSGWKAHRQSGPRSSLPKRRWTISRKRGSRWQHSTDKWRYARSFAQVAAWIASYRLDLPCYQRGHCARPLCFHYRMGVTVVASSTRYLLLKVRLYYLLNLSYI